MIEGQPGPAVTVVDMACFPGSSGSPVFVYRNGMVRGKDNAFQVGTQAIFIGVLFSGPVMAQNGEIVVRNIPTGLVPIAEFQLMINLGYVIKPKEIVALGKELYRQRGMDYPG